MIWFLAAFKQSGCETDSADKWSIRGANPTEVCQFQFSSLIDQQVLGLQVSVENFPPMTVGQTPKQLEKKQLQGEKPEGNEFKTKVVKFNPP